jgi:Glycosyl transferase 4-like domain
LLAMPTDATAPARRLRVTVLGGHYFPEPTGNAPYTAGLAQGLAMRGHDVRVITTHPHYPEWRIKDGYGGWFRDEEIRGGRVRRLAHYVPANPGGLRRLLSELSLGLRYLGTWCCSWCRTCSPPQWQRCVPDAHHVSPPGPAGGLTRSRTGTVRGGTHIGRSALITPGTVTTGVVAANTIWNGSPMGQRFA